MPIIFQDTIDNHTSIGMWHTIETEEALLEGLLLSKNDLEAILSMRLLKRRIERIACRKVLATLLNTNIISIEYNTNGKPITPGYHISFSHSGDYAAAIVSTSKETGLDIEKCTDRILTLQHKFINEKDKSYFDNSSVEDVTAIWCAKEALYKLFSNNHPEFLSELFIDESFESACFQSNKKETFAELHRWIVNDMMVVAALT